VLCLLNLAGQTPAFSQQSYIPWTVDPGPARESNGVGPTAPAAAAAAAEEPTTAEEPAAVTTGQSEPNLSILPGLSDSVGFVNYTAYKTSDKSYLVWRNDVLYDPRGYRTGFEGAFFETTLGFIYHITPWCVSRPEIRFDYSTGEKAYDNGTKRDQFTFNWDIIFRF